LDPRMVNASPALGAGGNLADPHLSSPLQGEERRQQPPCLRGRSPPCKGGVRGGSRWHGHRPSPVQAGEECPLRISGAAEEKQSNCDCPEQAQAQAQGGRSLLRLAPRSYRRRPRHPPGICCMGIRFALSSWRHPRRAASEGPSRNRAAERVLRGSGDFVSSMPRFSCRAIQRWVPRWPSAIGNDAILVLV